MPGSLQPRTLNLERLSARDRLIVALDFTALAAAVRMARQLRGLARALKVGSALFTASGPEAIRRIQSLGFRIMLDLKWFDIPSTVELSCRAAARHGVAMMTVHAAGGEPMLRAAVRAARSDTKRLRTARPLVLGVTTLTSAAEAVGASSSVTARVLALAETAANAGCDGIVASAQEAVVLRRRFGRRLRIVCPGIRPALAATDDPTPRQGSRKANRRTAARLWRSGGGWDDQRRVATPAEALERGADFLVVGRPITAARDPRKAATDMLHEMEVSSRC